MKILTDGTPTVKYDKHCKIVELTLQDSLISIDDCNMVQTLKNMLTAYKESFNDDEEGDRELLKIAISVMDYDLLEEYETKIKTLEEKVECEGYLSRGLTKERSFEEEIEYQYYAKVKYNV